MSNITAEQAVGVIEIVARQIVQSIAYNVEKYGDSTTGIEFKTPLTIQVLNVVNEWEKYPIKRVYQRRNVGFFIESWNMDQNDYMVTHNQYQVDDLIKILAQVQQANK